MGSCKVTVANYPSWIASEGVLAPPHFAQSADDLCANMRASSLSARDTANLDQNGLLTVRCRHAICHAFVSITGGEKFAYGLAGLAYLLEQGFQIERAWYDVGDSRFHAALQAFPHLSHVRPMLPELHAMMHALRCQVLWAGTTVTGAGLPNSEVSEQEFRRLGLVRRPARPAYVSLVRQLLLTCRHGTLGAVRRPCGRSLPQRREACRWVGSMTPSFSWKNARPCAR